MRGYMFRAFLTTAISMAVSAACVVEARAKEELLSRPAIIETGTWGSKTLLECPAAQMPVFTEGPTDEFLAGKKTHSERGILKCINITKNDGTVHAGGSGSITFTSGRRIEVVNCPNNTVPFVWNVTNYSLSYDPEKSTTSEYLALAPVIARCMEVTFWSQRK